MKRKQIFSDGGDSLLAGLQLNFSLTLTLYLSFLLIFIWLAPFCLHTPLSYAATTGKTGSLCETGLLRGWKRRIQVMWYQSIITFEMALHPWTILNGTVLPLSGGSQQRHSGQRPLEIICRTSKALCYHLPTRQTLSSCFLGHGNNMSHAFKQFDPCGNPDLECKHRGRLCWLA